jgi:hypothetical protein
MSQKPPAKIDFSSLRVAPGASAQLTPIEAAKAVFGEHPEDVIAPMGEAANVLKRLGV